MAPPSTGARAGAGLLLSQNYSAPRPGRHPPPSVCRFSKLILFHIGELPDRYRLTLAKTRSSRRGACSRCSGFQYYFQAPGPYSPNGLRLLHISDDPAETARAPVGDSLLGDAILSLAGLADLLGERKSRIERPEKKVPRPVAPTRRIE